MGHYEGKKRSRRAISDQKETNGGNSEKNWWKQRMVYYKSKTKSYVHKD